MKWKSLLGGGLALAAVAALALTVDLGQVWNALRHAGWGMAVVVLLHLPQTALTSAAWGGLLPARIRPGLQRLYLMRWIKESVNALLPGGQVAGDVIRARLLARQGVPLRTAAASCAVDVSLGAFSLFAYLALGTLVLLSGAYSQAGARLAGPALAVGGAMAVALALALRFGLMTLVERLGLRLSRQPAWAGLGQLSGLHDTVLGMFRDRRRLAACALAHFLAWGLGTLETYAAMTALGLQPTLVDALIVDSLGQGARAAGFAIPGALGVQEGGYVLVCSLFGIPAEQAVALSLIKRARELILGAPGLALWLWTDIGKKAGPPDA